jgi:hypothetical protein
MSVPVGRRSGDRARRELWQQSHRPVSAARTKDRARLTVRESPTQLFEPAGIVTRQVATALENSGVVMNAVAFSEDGEAGFK